MEQVKEAFLKVKQDMDILKNEITSLKKGLAETRQSIIDLCDLFRQSLNEKEEKSKQTLFQEIPTNQQIISSTPTYIPTHPTDFKPLKAEELGISTGNEGVPTDKQTNRQTNQQTDKSSYNQEKSKEPNSIDNAIKLLDSLDNLKKEIRLKFKRLTEQEMLVFSTLYQLSEEEEVDYKILANSLKLTESSIRDYVGRLIKKGIPVEKVKINNKSVHLFISPNLKKVASLPTILQLRDI